MPQSGLYLVHNRRNVTRLQLPAGQSRLAHNKATFFRGDNRYVLLDTLGDPAHVLLWDLARNETLTLGAPRAPAPP